MVDRYLVSLTGTRMNDNWNIELDVKRDIFMSKSEMQQR